MRSPYKGSRAEARALTAFVKLMRAASSLTGRLDRKLQQAGVTHAQFGVLEALLHVGPLCQRDLGRKILSSSGNMTMVIDNLEKRGLVRRVRGLADRRFVSVELTGEGRLFIAGLFPSHAATIEHEMSLLSGAEQDELARLCRRLGLGLLGPRGGTIV